MNENTTEKQSENIPVIDIALHSLDKVVQTLEEGIAVYGEDYLVDFAYGGELSAIPDLFEAACQRMASEKPLREYPFDGIVRRLERYSTCLLLVLEHAADSATISVVWKKFRHHLGLNKLLYNSLLYTFVFMQHLSSDVIDEVLAAYLEECEYAEGEMHRLLPPDEGVNKAIALRIKQARLEHSPSQFRSFGIESVVTVKKPYAVPTGSVRLVTYDIPKDINNKQGPQIPREIFSGVSSPRHYCLQVWTTPSGVLQMFIVEVGYLCDCCDHADEQEIYRLGGSEYAVSHDEMFEVSMPAEQLLGADTVADLVRTHREKAELVLAALKAYQPPTT